MVLTTTLEAVQAVLPDHTDDVQRTVHAYLNGDMSVCNPKAVIVFYRRYAGFAQHPLTVGGEWTTVSGEDAKFWLMKECDNDIYRLYCFMNARCVYVRDSDFVASGHVGIPFYADALAPIYGVHFHWELGEMREVCDSEDSYFDCIGEENELDVSVTTTYIWKTNIFHLMVANSPKTEVKRDPLRNEEKLLPLLGFTEHDWARMENGQYGSMSSCGKATLRGWYHLCGQEAPL